MSDPKLFDQERLDHLSSVIAGDIAAGRYYGAVIAVARGGRLGLHEAIGLADAAGAAALKLDSVFSIFSVTKAGAACHRARTFCADDAHQRSRA